MQHRHFMTIFVAVGIALAPGSAAMSGSSQQMAQSAQDCFKEMVGSETTYKHFREMVEQIIKENRATKSRDQIIALLEAKKKEFAMDLQKQAMDCRSPSP